MIGARVGDVRWGKFRPASNLAQLLTVLSCVSLSAFNVCLVAVKQIFVLNLTTSVFVFLGLSLRLAHYAFSAIDSIV